MKYFCFLLLFFIFLDAQPLNSEIGLFNDTSNLTSQYFNSQSNYLINNIVTFLFTITGVVTGGLISYLVTIRQLKQQSRMAYISTLLSQKDMVEKFSQFLQKIEMCRTSNQSLEQDVQEEVKKTWFFMLFAPAKNRYRELIYHLKNKEWDKAIETIIKFLDGNW